MNNNSSFISHLLELRNRLLKVIGFLLLVTLGLFPFANNLYVYLAMPLLKSLPLGGQMIATGVMSPFFIPMKVAMLTAFVVSLPFTLYQVWGFIAPAMYKHERQMIGPLVFASTALFFCGMAFAYYLVFPVVFGFISNAGPSGVAVMTDIGNYLDFVMSLFIAFGLSFEVPIAVILLVLSRTVSIVTLREARSYVVVGAFVLGAILTPPDIISQFMLAIPIWLLYEAGILISQLMVRKFSTENNTSPSKQYE